MSPRLRRWLAQGGSFVLAGVLLYLALRGVDLAVIGEALRAADYRWLPPLVAVVLLSHLLRAWRWKLLLEALPPDDAEGGTPRPVSLRVAFYSVMIGYMVNYAAPRLGEVARTANLATRARLRFSSVFGTVVVERILDMLVLLGAIGSVALLLLDRLAVVEELFIAPLLAQVGRLPVLGLAGVALGVGVLVLLIYRQVMRREDALVRRFWDRRVRPLLASFQDGLATLLRSRHRLLLTGTTVGIWFCYVLMAYLPFVILGMHQTFGLSLLDTWVIMTIGAIGIVIPSPGGTGSYHYITIQTLVHLFGVAQAPAATYAVLAHAAQLILYVLVGAICMMLQGSSLQTLREKTAAAQEGASS